MEKTKKNFFRLTFYASLISTVLYLLLSAIYIILGSNIVYASYISLVELFIWIVNVLSYAVIFSFFIYFVSKDGIKKSLVPVFLYCAIILIKNLSVPIINSIILGNGLDVPDIMYPLLVWLFDVVLAFAVLFISAVKRHPRSVIALIVGILLSATTLLPRIAYDIDYGAPSSAQDLFVMVLAYASDLLVIAIVYFVSHFVFKYLQRGK